MQNKRESFIATYYWYKFFWRAVRQRVSMLQKIHTSSPVTLCRLQIGLTVLESGY